MKKLIEKIRTNGELRLFLRHSVFTGITTLISLILRFFLMQHLGTYTVDLFGRSFSFTITDSTAYYVYYITGIVLLYLLKWFTANGVQPRSFLPRLLAFCTLYAVSMLCGGMLLRLFTDRFGIGEELAFWLTCPVTFAINFLGSRLIVFCDSENRQSRKYSSLSEKEGVSDGRKERAEQNNCSE